MLFHLTYIGLPFIPTATTTHPSAPPLFLYHRIIKNHIVYEWVTNFPTTAVHQINDLRLFQKIYQSWNSISRSISSNSQQKQVLNYQGKHNILRRRKGNNSLIPGISGKQGMTVLFCTVIPNLHYSFCFLITL